MDSIRVFAPATVANIVCGFDVLGFAVNVPGDEVILRLTGPPGVRIRAIHGDGGLLPTDPYRNTASAVVMRYLELTGDQGCGVEIELFKKMPVGSGLGSSAASTIAGLFAINTLRGSRVDPDRMLAIALEGERIACGQGHADNVAPALLGGFVLIRSYDPLDVIRLHTPAHLVCALVHPQIEIQTRDARRIIKKMIPLSDTVRQMGNVGALVAGLYQENDQLISRSMQDVIIEPTRAILIPGFYRLREIALEQGALGFGISGSGPAIFALSSTREAAQCVVEALRKELFRGGIDSEGYVSSVNREGPSILEGNPPSVES
ncbi:MAG TPA: homoserine kinase [Chitinophagaceae bacterium]|nr:homoserine kinase [Chitinophagaceae bacterium]